MQLTGYLQHYMGLCLLRNLWHASETTVFQVCRMCEALATLKV